MLPVSEELKELYKKTSIQKQIVMSVAGGEETITNHDLFDFSIKETICSEEELTLGGCEASVLKMRIDAMYDIVGKQLDVVQVVDGIHEMPFGSYKVDSAKRTDDFRYRDIIAYDISKYALDKDVANWYNNDVIFPLPLKMFRELLFAYIELPLEDQDLINDSVLIEKTIKPSTMTAREIAKAIGEITGTFGMMRRSGEFSFIKMSEKGLYPAEDLYPEEDLYPAEVEAFFSKSGYFNSHYEDYVVKGIDSLKICMEEGDVGAVVDKGSLENPYIIVGNFLVYGKNHEQLSAIGREILDNISDIIYIPQVTTIVGLPYLEPGDSVVILTKYLDVESYIFTRVLKGVQSLRDEIEATGSESRENKVSPNQEIQILKGKSFVLEKTVDGLDIKITDVEANAIAKIEATATEIREEVSTLDNSLRSEISLTAKEIRGEVADEVNDLHTEITFTAWKIEEKIEDEKNKLSNTITKTAGEIREELKDEKEGLYNAITKTASDIRVEMTNERKGITQEINASAEKLNVKIADVSGKQNTLSLTVDELSNEIYGEEGEYSGLKHTVNGLYLDINGTDGKFAKLEATVNGFDFTGFVQIKSLETPGMVQIDGGNIKGGTLTLGGANNGNGFMKILDASGKQIGSWGEKGLFATKGTFSGDISGATGTFSGDISAASGIFKGSIYSDNGSFWTEITDGRMAGGVTGRSRTGYIAFNTHLGSSSNYGTKIGGSALIALVTPYLGIARNGSADLYDDISMDLGRDSSVSIITDISTSNGQITGVTKKTITFRKGLMVTA